MSRIRHLAYAIRLFRRSPTWTAVTVFTLALGVGAAVAVFTLVDHVLLRALPYGEPDRLVRLYQTFESSDRESVSPPNFLDWRAAASSFEDLASVHFTGVTLTGRGEPPRRLRLAHVTASMLEVLRLEPHLGRGFAEGENQPGADRVVVLDHAFFMNRFGGDPSLIGDQLMLDGRGFEVIGVLPPGVNLVGASAELWKPHAFPATVDRGSQYTAVLGRLRAGVSLAAARAEMATIGARLRQAFPDDNAATGIQVEPLHDEHVRGVRRALLVLLGAVGCLLLIACANVAHLLLARWRDRRGELVVRTALGATVRQLVAQMVVEAGLLAVAGGVFGLLAAHWLLDLFVWILPEILPGPSSARIDGRIVAFALVLVTATVGLFGLTPALVTSRGSQATRDASRNILHSGDGRDRVRLGRALVVVEVALAAVLMIAAGLLGRSLTAALRIDPGFRAEGVVTLNVALPEERYDSLARTATFWDALLGSVRAMPEVEAASAVGFLPLGGGWNCSFRRQGHPDDVTTKGIVGAFRPVASDYFRTLGIPLLRGRGITELDRSDSPPVIVINEAFAARYYADVDPLGQRLCFDCGDPEDVHRTIVGVVGNVRLDGLTDGVRPAYYIPHSQLAWDAMSLVVRTSGEPGPLVSAVRAEVARLDPELAVYGVGTLAERHADAVAQPRFHTLLLGAFAVLALVLGAAGVYGVMAYSVARRRREIGIRAALGASAGKIFRAVLGEGMGLLFGGLVIGLGLSAAAARLLRALLYEVEAFDPATFVAMSLLLALAILAACALPARRASQVDLVRLLRVD